MTRVSKENVIDPRSMYPTIDPPEQQQPEPGLDQELIPVADIGLDSYEGSGRLRGKKALITGADSGIGAAVAVAYAREGADIAIAYLPSEEPDAKRIIQAAREAGRNVVAIPGDLSDPDYCRRLVDEAAEQLGGIDILVNNASRQYWADGIENIPDESFDQTMKVNLYGTFHVTKRAMRYLKAGASIISSSSVQAYNPSKTLIDYAMTKAAMNNMSKSLAEQLTPQGIRVNAVAPGPVWTPLQPSHGQPMDKLTSFGQESGLGRAGQPAELAGAYVFLASDEASFVSGETLGVTGGTPTP